jgi:hypothetical protein
MAGRQLAGALPVASGLFSLSYSPCKLASMHVCIQQCYPSNAYAYYNHPPFSLTHRDCFKIAFVTLWLMQAELIFRAHKCSSAVNSGDACSPQWVWLSLGVR